jgi:hypothetical protein
MVNTGFENLVSSPAMVAAELKVSVVIIKLLFSSQNQPSKSIFLSTYVESAPLSLEVGLTAHDLLRDWRSLFIAMTGFDSCLSGKLEVTWIDDSPIKIPPEH